MVLERVKLWTVTELSKQALDYFRKQGRKGGLLGGKIRASKLTKAERQAIARKAAAARWKDKNAKSGGSGD